MSQPQNEFLDLVQFAESFDYAHDNDREIVIVGCAYIECLIKNTLSESLLQDKVEIDRLIGENNGILSGLVPKVRLLYLMSVFPKVIYEDIKLVAKIRNHFAHNVSASFEDLEVTKNLGKLRWHIESMNMSPPPEATTRDIYQVAINQLVAHLNALPAYARFTRIKNGN